ncbi:MAG: addiction module protein [Candidatus Nealsonbacteria bacterium]|nr:addiction module protein [Candidatus Nealsonbacteria bacterium]
MSTKMESLLVELLGLPASSRATLAKQLLASLEEDELPDVQSRWMEVAKRRIAEINEGKVECIPAEEVFRELREELG